MISTNLQQLLFIASGPEWAGPPEIAKETAALAVPFTDELIEVLKVKNGFYAFESALHVFPAGPQSFGMDLNKWNAAATWRFAYRELADGCLFFAEDIFGDQFCVWRDAIYSFEAETGEKELLATSLDEWADTILRDYNFQTGYPLAHAWQEQHGPLPEGDRLIPTQPFVLGGAYSLENLYALEKVQGMRFRGDLATQLLHLPDGATVRLKTVD